MKNKLPVVFRNIFLEMNRVPNQSLTDFPPKTIIIPDLSI